MFFNVKYTDNYNSHTHAYAADVICDLNNTDHIIEYVHWTFLMTIK
jgi:hypothetical protein